MSIKLIAIGNRIMGDDSLAIIITEKLEKYFISLGIEIIIGETDFEYCLSEIENGDYLIIVDSTYFKVNPGTITVSSFSHINKINYNNSSFSQHSNNFLANIDRFYKSITGVVIGIEGINFDYSLSISNVIEEKMEYILSEVRKTVVSVSALADYPLSAGNSPSASAD